MLVVPQSFGDLLVAHPHAHALVSLGVFLRDGTFYPLDDADFSPLEAIFRERNDPLLRRRGDYVSKASRVDRSPAGQGAAAQSLRGAHRATHGSRGSTHPGASTSSQPPQRPGK